MPPITFGNCRGYIGDGERAPWRTPPKPEQGVGLGLPDLDPEGVGVVAPNPRGQ